MPAGLEITLPMPVPWRITCRVWGWPVKVAMTWRSSVMDTVQLPMPLQAPPQPLKVEPVDAMALSVTLPPSGKLSVQSPPQFTPVGDDDTRPDPVPLRATVSVRAGPARKLICTRFRPLTVPPGRVSVTLAPWFLNRASASVTLMPGWACFITAQAPATWGAAMEVPLNAA